MCYVNTVWELPFLIMRTCFFQRPRPLAIMSFPKCFTDTTLSPGVGCFDSASWQPLHGVDVVTQRGGRGCYLPVKPQLWVPAGNLMMNDFNCFFFLMYCQHYHIKQALSEENSRIRAVSLGISFKGLCCGPRAFGYLTTLGSFKGIILLLTLFCMSV